MRITLLVSTALAMALATSAIAAPPRTATFSNSATIVKRSNNQRSLRGKLKVFRSEENPFRHGKTLTAKTEVELGVTAPISEVSLGIASTASPTVSFLAQVNPRNLSVEDFEFGARTTTTEGAVTQTISPVKAKVRIGRRGADTLSPAQWQSIGLTKRRLAPGEGIEIEVQADYDIATQNVRDGFDYAQGKSKFMTTLGAFSNLLLQRSRGAILSGRENL